VTLAELLEKACAVVTNPDVSVLVEVNIWRYRNTGSPDRHEIHYRVWDGKRGHEADTPEMALALLQAAAAVTAGPPLTPEQVIVGEVPPAVQPQQPPAPAAAEQLTIEQARVPVDLVDDPEAKCG
jgi:hypothetical protein